MRVKYEREGREHKAIIVRMAVARVKSIRDLMELMTTAATYARHKQDATAVRHCSETLDGVVQILVENHEFEQRMTQRIQQVKPYCACVEYTRTFGHLSYRWRVCELV